VSQALVISPRDNVATALEPLEAGQIVRAADAAVKVLEAIPRGHKLALRPIAQGEPVVKYGSPIGIASADIPAGRHVHTHNVASTRGRGDLHGRSAASTVTDPDQARIAEPPDRSHVDSVAPDREP
jgi:altronate hydrolase